MPNDVTNRLEIHCEDEKIMDKIRMMIFDEEENKNIIYTMNKMLPRPAKFSDRQGYHDYGYYWSRAIWGTKWDVYDASYEESVNTLILHYDTAWSPNSNWVEFLCMYIQKILNPFDSQDIHNISVTHQYYDIMGDFGGVFEWVPFTEAKDKVYSVMEYAKLHDSELYYNLVRFEKDITVSDNEVKPTDGK